MNSTFRSRQDLNNAMVSRHADDLRRVCGMTSYARGREDGVDVHGVTLDEAPRALDILGLGDAIAVATLLPDNRRWLSRVVHYRVGDAVVARWQGGRDVLTLVRCPETAPAAYPYNRAVNA